MPPIVLIIIIAIIVILVKKKGKSKKESKTTAPVTVVEPSKLPDTMGGLRKAVAKAKNNAVMYQTKQQLCLLGMQLFQEGKLVVKQGDENDATQLMQDMHDLLNDYGNSSQYIPNFEAFKFRCLETGMAIGQQFQNVPGYRDFDFVNYGWTELADMYAEGKVCPRNPVEARRYYRLRLIYEGRMKDIKSSTIESLMNIPEAGEGGRQEILKAIALMYGQDAVKLLVDKSIARNCFAQTLQQAAELLFQMDWGRIGSADISAMLDEYHKGAQAGNAYAQYKLGQFYLDGCFVEKNTEMGVDFLRKAAKQELYLAVNRLSNYYYWAAEDESLSKKERKHNEGLSYTWSRESDKVLASVEAQYANSFTGYIENSKGLATSGVPKWMEQQEEIQMLEKDPDMDSPFTILDLPEVITGPYQRTYRRQVMHTYGADYMNEFGETTTIRLSEIKVGIAGYSVNNSSGYFYW